MFGELKMKRKVEIWKKYKDAIKKKWKISLCGSKTNECYKNKNLIKNTSFKLQYVQQHRNLLRTPSNI